MQNSHFQTLAVNTRHRCCELWFFGNVLPREPIWCIKSWAWNMVCSLMSEKLDEENPDEASSVLSTSLCLGAIIGFLEMIVLLVSSLKFKSRTAFGHRKCESNTIFLTIAHKRVTKSGITCFDHSPRLPILWSTVETEWNRGICLCTQIETLSGQLLCTAWETILEHPLRMWYPKLHSRGAITKAPKLEKKKNKK